VEQPVLETERLILRPFVDIDAPRLAKLAGDKAVSDTTLRIPYPYNEVMALAWIGTHQSVRDKGLAIFYAIDLKESINLIGSIGIDVYHSHRRATIGYWIGREYWNMGYATEAASILLEYVFNVMNLHKVDSHYFVRNQASGRVLEKLGMKREGLLREHILKSGLWEDIIECGILDSEYEQIETGLKGADDVL
jgi:[ribosomal protein S5]-alanine N-acetyltransferase